MTKLNELLIGIDFGTTNTIIGIFNNNKVEIISDNITNIIPSKIGIKDNKFYCGNSIPNDSIIINNFKLNILNNEYNINNLSNNDLLIIYFTYLFNLIKNKYNNISIIKCVITVPSNFNDNERKIIKNALINVGFIVLYIINEPTAAAVSYGLNYSANNCEKILVIDIGGGTTDITLLEKNDLFFQVIDSYGYNDLGGNNITEYILSDILNNNDINKLLEEKTLNLLDLWYISQNIKEKLSILEIYKIEINNIEYILSQQRLEILIKNILIKLKKLLLSIYNKYNNIDYVILVGGTNNITCIKNIINNIFKNVWTYPDLELAVVSGACLYAGILENQFISNEQIILLDSLHSSLGVELLDGTFSIIIDKNTPLPIKKNNKYITNNDNNIKIKIYQGENKIANKNKLISEIIFNKLSNSAIPIIYIEFKIDINSILYVKVKDKYSGHEELFIIKDNYNNKFNNIDNIDNIEINQDDIISLQLTYKINNIIKNILIEIDNNNLLLSENKDNIINKINNINNKLDKLNYLELLSIFKELEQDFVYVKYDI